MRALDREYAAWARRSAQGPARGSVRRPRRAVDVRGWLAFVVALVGVALLVVAQPGLLPAPARDLAGLGPKRLAAVPRASGSGSFAFLAHQPGDPETPVAYDPCRPVEVRINPAGGPPGAVDLVRRAMAEVSTATGLDLRFDGLTDERPQWKSMFVPSFLGRPRTRPVLVSWATEAQVPELAGDVAGIGGSLPGRGADGVFRYVTGGVTLDAGSFSLLATRPEGTAQMGAIVLHELGHVVGLAHVHDRGELMNSENLGLLDFGTGDRLGLARLGSGSCA
jgi:hypothetical protein